MTKGTQLVDEEKEEFETKSTTIFCTDNPKQTGN